MLRNSDIYVEEHRCLGIMPTRNLHLADKEQYFRKRLLAAGILYDLCQFIQIYIDLIGYKVDPLWKRYRRPILSTSPLNQL